jgi:hypothetical protein
MVHLISETNLPTVFALEDPQTSFEPILLSDNAEVEVTGLIVEQVLEKPPSSIVVEDDIWASSTTIISLRDILNIPEVIPIIPYTYCKPLTLQNIMTTLIAEMA